MQSSVLREAKRLHNLGFGIHWLMPKSKRPLESGWTTGGRKDWKELEKTYRPGLNVGVRLGKASQVGKKFLAVIDVDVKSQEERHRKEVLERISVLTKVRNLPSVKSGRGNGSRHYYILTPEPIAPFKAEQSSEVVKVLMPSTQPSKKELAALTSKEINEGIRLRPAWEIALMGEGQQVVLPPSVHPDSGKPYAWVVPFEMDKALDFDEGLLKKKTANVDKSVDKVDNSKPPAQRTLVTGLTNFEPVFIDVNQLVLSKKIKDMIIDGTGVEDRSAMLLPITRSLFKAGLKQNEILSILTDKDNYLGHVGYDHAKTSSQAVAAAWVYRYTLAKVKREDSAVNYFTAPVEEAAPRTPEQIEESEKEIDEFETYGTNGGFYFYGAKGGLVPDYEGLFEEFKEAYPYKMIADMKFVYSFNGTHYEDMTPFEIKNFAEQSFNPKPSEKYRLEFLNKVFANNVERRSFFIKTTEDKLNFKNGVLCLDDDGFMGPQLKSHSPEFGFRGVLPYEFNPKAKCPFFDNWIRSIMCDDPALILLIQEFMGYIVRGGDYKYHKALWLGGTGRNGKSTFIDLLKALIGSGNFSTISIKSIVGDKFAGSDLDGKLANFSEETSPQELADSGPFKNLTGDGELYAQKKFGHPYCFRNRAKLVMTYNEIPDLKDLSPGMLSRPIIVPFLKVIKDEDQDRSTKKKLFEELSGIFNFALAGWERLEEQNGFTRSEKSEKALKKVRQESCSAYTWAENYIEPVDYNDPDAVLRPVEIYEAYCKKEKFAYRENKFYQRLNSHPLIKSRRKRFPEGVRYMGLKIRGYNGLF